MRPFPGNVLLYGLTGSLCCHAWPAQGPTPAGLAREKLGMAASPRQSPQKFPVYPAPASRSMYVRHEFTLRAQFDMRHYARMPLAGNLMPLRLDLKKKH